MEVAPLPKLFELGFRAVDCCTVSPAAARSLCSAHNDGTAPTVLVTRMATSSTILSNDVLYLKVKTKIVIGKSNKFLPYGCTGREQVWHRSGTCHWAPFKHEKASVEEPVDRVGSSFTYNPRVVHFWVKHTGRSGRLRGFPWRKTRHSPDFACLHALCVFLGHQVEPGHGHTVIATSVFGVSGYSAV